MSASHVVVEIGGWEHQCCGPAVEIGDVVEYGVVPTDGARRFEEVRHDTVRTQTIRGRVVELYAVGVDGRVAVERIPSGSALCGSDEDDDGHLEARWTGQPIAVEWAADEEFEVVIDPYGKPKRQ
ncbi:hypothetical protein [Curtobacterium flaccumfaciens]|uniref:hypothetical protein n=1 Tax=Curtobacterium flaccumfaciens TaxID=2035 RepID=UPI001BDDF89C|nr:hypothetical protein [Curtobacterium flaccumfaciens]MBT1672494.1 hypothetical protein [Curtobacterium flaccumfaciens pv. flaccumfaciens]